METRAPFEFSKTRRCCESCLKIIDGSDTLREASLLRDPSTVERVSSGSDAGYTINGDRVFDGLNLSVVSRWVKSESILIIKDKEFVSAGLTDVGSEVLVGVADHHIGLVGVSRR